MLPFNTHYNNAPDFMATAHAVFANADAQKRIDTEIQDGTLKAKKQHKIFLDNLISFIIT